MNFVDYLIHEKALGNVAKRSEIASKSLSDDIDACVTIWPKNPAIGSANTNAMLRFALSDASKPMLRKARDSQLHRTALEILAANGDPDFDVLRQITIRVVEEQRQSNEPHIEYLSQILKPRETWKLLMKRCHKAANSNEDGCPFVVVDGALALKTDEVPIADKTFQNWLWLARKNNKKRLY